MTVEIIHRGTPQIDQTRQFTCPYCQSVISFNGYDTYAANSRRYTLPAKAIECPVCRNECIVEEYNHPYYPPAFLSNV